MATPKTSINIHPKVFVGLLVGFAVAAIAGITNSLDPSVFASLGVWQAPALSLATTGLAVLGGWLKGVQTDGQKAAVKAAKAAVKVAASEPALTAAVVTIDDFDPAIVTDIEPAEPTPVALPDAVPDVSTDTQPPIFAS